MPGGVAFDKLLKDALDSGQIELREVRFSNAPLPTRRGSHLTDVTVVEVAQQCAREDKDTILASEDADVVRMANHLGIKTMHLSQLRQYLSSAVSINKEIENQAAIFSRAQKHYMVVSLVISLGVVASLVLVAYEFQSFVNTISIGGTVFLVIVAASLAYFSRSRYPICYGVVEILIGIAATIRVFWPDFDYSHVSQADILTIAGGIYIMVRGQDNLGRGLTRTRWGTIWKRYSGD